jgi:hypothetical protein
MPEPMWARRRTGFPLDESFQFGSFRSAPDQSGDFLLIDGYNGASRNPHHSFAILELRLGGHTLLKGYRNQLLTRLDGMVEPRVAMDARLRDRHVIGDVAVCVGEVPDAAYCNWRRTLAQRVGQYALVVDQLTMRRSTENFQVQTLWETPRGTWDEARNAIVVRSGRGAADELRHEIVASDPVRAVRQSNVFSLEWTGAAREGETLAFFSLIGAGTADGRQSECLRLGNHAAALSLPQPAVAVAGPYAGTEAELALIADDHLYARRAAEVAAGDGTLLSASAPVTVHWDFVAETLTVLAEEACTLSLRAASDDLACNGKRECPGGSRDAGGRCSGRPAHHHRRTAGRERRRAAARLARCAPRRSPADPCRGHFDRSARCVAGGAGA